MVGKIEGISFIYFDERDVVRHNLVQRIIKAYDEHAASHPRATTGRRLRRRTRRTSLAQQTPRRIKLARMILNRQRRVRVSISGFEKFLAAARKRLRLAPRFSHRCLVTDAEIARWNRAYPWQKSVRPMYCPSQQMAPSQNPQLHDRMHQPRRPRSARLSAH